jgi:preprotein translocase subunit SecF
MEKKMKLLGFLVILALIAGGVYLSGGKTEVKDVVEDTAGTVAEYGQAAEEAVEEAVEDAVPSVDVDANITDGTLPDVDVNSQDTSTEAKKIEVPTGADVEAAVEKTVDGTKEAVGDAKDAVADKIDAAKDAIVKQAE